MIEAFTDIYKGLELLEEVDKKLSLLLEADKFEELINTLNERMTIIGQIHTIKRDSSLSQDVLDRLGKIWVESNKVLKLVLDKRQSIKTRLNGRTKNKCSNKKFAY